MVLILAGRGIGIPQSRGQFTLSDSGTWQLTAPTRFPGFRFVCYESPHEMIENQPEWEEARRQNLPKFWSL